MLGSIMPDMLAMLAILPPDASDIDRTGRHTTCPSSTPVFLLYKGLVAVLVVDIKLTPHAHLALLSLVFIFVSVFLTWVFLLSTLFNFIEHKHCYQHYRYRSTDDHGDDWCSKAASTGCRAGAAAWTITHLASVSVIAIAAKRSCCVDTAAITTHYGVVQAFVNVLFAQWSHVSRLA